jgi:hypothetical protein
MRTISRRFRGLSRFVPWTSRRFTADQARDRGDTLIEVLFALMVLGLASVALLLAFSTTISSSATHRTLSAENVALEAAAQEAESGISSQISLFGCPSSSATFNSAVPLTIPSQDGNYTAQIASVQWWNGNSFSSTTCTVNTAVEVTVNLTSATGQTLSTTFVVEYPLGTTLSSGPSGTVPYQLVFVNSPSGTIGSGSTFPSGQQPQVEVEDQNGNPVVNDFSPVILSLVSSTQGTLQNCVGSQDAGNGIVTFSGCSVTLNSSYSTGTFSLQASDTSISATASWPQTGSFTVSTSTAAPQLVFLNTPTPGNSGSQMSNVSGQSYQFRVAVQQNGTTITGWTGSLALTTSGSTPSLPQLSGCTGLTAPVSGIFKISNCSFVGGVAVVNGISPIYYTMTATATPSGTSAQPNSGRSNAFGVTGPGPATQLAFSTQPIGGASASTPVSFASSSIPIVVEALDSFGNTATSATGSATLTISSGLSSTNGTVPETLSSCGGSNAAAFSSGFATFTSCAASAYAHGITLTATDGALNTKSSAFDITNVPATLKFTTNPQAAASGSEFVIQPVIGIYDTNGLLVTGETSSLGQSPTATAVTPGASTPQLTQCTGFSPTLGYISLESCAFVGTVGAQYTMSVSLVTSSGTVTATSADFSPTGPGAPSQLNFVTSPVGGPSGSQFTTQPVILIEDSGGNLTTVSNVTVSLSLNQANGSLAGCSNLSSVAGVITVANCSFSGVVGTPYTLTVTSTAPVLTPDISNSFTPSAAGAAAQLAVTAFPTSSVTAGSPLSGVSFSIEDSYGNLVSTGPGSNDVLSVSLGGSSGVSLQPGPNPSLTAVAGVVNLSSEAIQTVGSYALTATDTSETLPIASTITSSPLSVVAAASNKMTFTSQPGGGNAAAVWAVQPALTITDAYGNTALPDVSTVNLTIASGPTGAVLSGCTQSESNGVISFHGCYINKSGAYTLLATDSNGAVSTATSLSFTIFIGPVTQAFFTTQPGGSVGENVNFTQPVITLEDAGGNVVTNDNTSTVALSVNSFTGATLGYSTQGSITGCSQAISSGVVTFSNCKITGTKAAGSYTLKAIDSDTGNPSTTSSGVVTVTSGVATSAAFTTQPGGSVGENVAFTQPVATVYDANANIATTDASSVTIGVNSYSAGASGGATQGTLTGCNVPTESLGTFTFSGCKITGTKAAGTYVLKATDSLFATPAVASGTVSITAGVGTQLSFSTQPGGGTDAVAWPTQPGVTVLDANSNVAVADASTVTLSINTGTPGSLSGCTPSESLGVVSFSGCSINKPGTYTLKATDSVGGVTTATSSSLGITLGPVTQAVFTTQPGGSVGENANFTQPVVTLEDAGGNVVTTDTTSTVTLSVNTYSAGASGGSTQGSVTGCSQAISAGVVTFSNCKITGAAAAGSYTLKATDSDTGNPSTNSSGTVSITAGVGTQTIFSAQPGGSVGENVAFTQPVVTILDANGNVAIANASTVVIGVNGFTAATTGYSTQGTVTGCNTPTESQGTFTFSGCKITGTKAAGSYTLKATDSGIATPAVATGIVTITPGAATSVAFSTQPGGSVGENVAFTQPVATVYDTNSNVATSDSSTVTIGVNSFTAATTGYSTQGTVTGCNTPTESQGTFTFSGCKITGTKAAGTYTLNATDSLIATPAVATGIVTITPGAASKLAFTVQPAASVWNGSLGFSAATVDTNSNIVSSTDVITATLSSSSFTPMATPSVTASGGVATFSGLKANAAGKAYTITASDTTNSGYTSATSTSVTIFGTTTWQGSNTGSASTSYTLTPVTAASGLPAVIMVSYYTNSNAAVCSKPTSAAFTVTTTPIETSLNWSSATNNYYGYCVYAASGTGTAGNVAETLSGGTGDYVAIQVVQVTGDTSAVLSGVTSSSNTGTSATPTFALGASTTGDSEIALGDVASNATLTAPTGFSAPTGMAALTGGKTTTLFTANVLLGPATTSTTGTWSASGNWGTYGIDVTP